MPTISKDKIVILGGSFNPCTLAHIDTIKRAMQLINANHGIILPVGNKYDKSSLIDFKYRFEMLKLANDDNFEISDYENQQIQPKTLQSLTHFQKLYPNADLYFIMGDDNLRYLDKWYKPNEILDNFFIISLSRNNNQFNKLFENPFLNNYKDKIIELDINPQYADVSSSSVRTLIKNKKYDQLSYFLHPKVITYIIQNNLYVT